MCNPSGPQPTFHLFSTKYLSLSSAPNFHGQSAALKFSSKHSWEASLYTFDSSCHLVVVDGPYDGWVADVHVAPYPHVGWGRNGWDLIYFDAAPRVQRRQWSNLVCDLGSGGVLECGKGKGKWGMWMECGDPGLLGIGWRVGAACSGGVSVVAKFV